MSMHYGKALWVVEAPVDCRRMKRLACVERGDTYYRRKELDAHICGGVIQNFPDLTWLAHGGFQACGRGCSGRSWLDSDLFVNSLNNNY